jgi:hypothetical protein
VAPAMAGVCDDSGAETLARPSRVKVRPC